MFRGLYLVAGEGGEQLVISLRSLLNSLAPLLCMTVEVSARVLGYDLLDLLLKDEQIGL